MKDNKKIVDTGIYMPVLQELIQEGKEVSITITGNSMSPFLVHERDQIMISPPNDPWKKGDMAFYKRWNGCYVMHRICKVDKHGQCFFIGDGQQGIEGPIAPEQIFGKITSVRRKGKWIGPKDFVWFFFERIWIRIIPLRPACRRLYAVLWNLR